jgi:two-component system response regulator PilR (NtrC family)
MVLVVEDEPSIRQFIVETLTDEGYRVRTAADGILALAVLEQNDVDVVLADVRMPRLDGIALAHQVRQQHPTLSIVLMSALAVLPAIPGIPVLNKPFTIEQLEQRLVEALAQLRER